MVVTSPASRFGAGLLAFFWCATLLLRPVVTSCPMGSLHAAPVHGEAAHAEAAHAEAAHAEAADAAGEHSNSLPDAQHPCDCLSHCCATAVVQSSEPVVARTALVRIVSVVRTRWSVRVTADWSHVLLPFATAPPGLEHG